MSYYGNYGHGTQYDEYARTKTPRESARETLINLRFEQRKDEPDADRLTGYHRDLAQYKTEDVLAAFDAIVDEGGW